MADYSDLKLTNLGLDLLAKVQAGTTDLTFARFGMGNGSFYFPGDVPTMAALVNEKMTRPVLNTVRLDQAAEVSTIIANADLPVAGFDMSEIGLFATDPDVGEILYGMVYAGATADHIPAAGDGMAYDYVINLIVTVSDAEQVTVVVDSATAATKAEMAAQALAHAVLVVNPTITSAGKAHVTHTQAKKWEDHGKSVGPVHGASSAGIPNALMVRDISGRCQVDAPALSVDIARKKEVDDEGTARALADSTHAALAVNPTTTGAVKAHVTNTQAKAWEDHKNAAHAPSNANYYGHPATHPPSIILQTASARFVTDIEKSTWNGKPVLGETSTKAYRGDLGKVAYDHSQVAHAPSNANYYAHPGTHPPSIIAETTSDRFVSDAEKLIWNGKAKLGETSVTAYRGDRGKVAYDHSQAAHFSGTVTQKSTRTTTGVWTISGVVVGKPLFLELNGTGPGQPACYFKATAGTLTGTSDANWYYGGSGGTAVQNVNSPSFTIIPTATTVSFSVFYILACTMRAYQ